MAASAKDFSTRSTMSGCSTACARRWSTTVARWATSRRPTSASRPPARCSSARGVPADHIGSVITGNMAPGDFDQFFLPRHIGLYAGVPVDVPAQMAQRICGTGFELFRQAGEQIQGGQCEAALVVGTESMTRNPIAAFDHRTGFKLGAPVGFKDYMWEALNDPAAGINMIQTAENLAKKYNITREEVDQFAPTPLPRPWPRSRPASTPVRSCPSSPRSSSCEGYASPRHQAAGQGRPKWRRTPMPASRPSRCWPSSSPCTRVACRPVATARRWWMRRPRPSSLRAPTRRPRARSRWPAWWLRPWSACRPRSWASVRRRRSACCWSAPA